MTCLLANINRVHSGLLIPKLSTRRLILVGLYWAQIRVSNPMMFRHYMDSYCAPNTRRRLTQGGAVHSPNRCLHYLMKSLISMSA